MDADERVHSSPGGDFCGEAGIPFSQDAGFRAALERVGKGSGKVNDFQRKSAMIAKALEEGKTETGFPDTIDTINKIYDGA
jgi:hypothetical protein